MVFKCRLCKREFDTKRQKAQHERDAHPEGAVQYFLSQAEKKATAEIGKDKQQ